MEGILEYDNVSGESIQKPGWNLLYDSAEGSTERGRAHARTRSFPLVNRFSNACTNSFTDSPGYSFLCKSFALYSQTIAKSLS